MTGKGVDMVEFQRLLNFEEDDLEYEISSTFPAEPEYHLRHLIDYRIKLLLKNDIILEPSESKLVVSSCKIPQKHPQLSMHLKGYENLPVAFESEGFISPKFFGVIRVKLGNYTNSTVTLPSGMIVGYVILQPFALL